MNSMISIFLKLELLKLSRSTAFVKSILMAVFIGILGLVLFSYLLLLGFFLQTILTQFAETSGPYELLSSYLIYFFLIEFIYRYFFQKLPVFELQHFLHLPISKRKIIHFLLVKSFISPLNIIPLLLFSPFAFQEVGMVYGTQAAWSWLAAILLTSWSLHWLMLWFKQKFEDSLIGLIIVFVVLLLGTGSSFFGWFNLGTLMKPLFDWSLSSVLTPLGLLAVFFALYRLAYGYYLKNAYLEDLMEEKEAGYMNSDLGFFQRFGLAGELANLEWKLIIRHKKSRSYLTLAGFFLLYGLIFYSNPQYQTEEGFSHFFVFVGSFITGIFMYQYGQLFLSWNSANFDFFLGKKSGIESLIKGKYLLFMATSVLCYLLSLPYVYFGWEILLIHTAAFLFNIGVIMHFVVYLALWKPKPMDLNKGAMFNYEGVGIAQFLMIIPMLIAPYLVYLPFALWIGQYAGLVAMAIAGGVGLLAFPKLTEVAVKRVHANRYQISSSFRQEV